MAEDEDTTDDDATRPLTRQAPDIPHDETVRLDRVIVEGSLGLPSHFGRYEVMSRIGIGGFASVFAARDPELDAPVAIKVLAENHSADVEIRRRFVAEARVARRLASERLIGVFDLGETDDGRPFVVMELAAGGTLRARLSRLGRPTRASLLRLIDELGQCMIAIHDKGVVHRDIKPSNLLLRQRHDVPQHRPTALIDDDETLVLADFGLARDISAGASAMTVGGGTAGYMAPEQADPNGKADVRADIYAATVVLAELTTGRHPERLDLGTARLVEPVRRALERSLALDRELRPSTAAAWREEMLAAYGSDEATTLITPADPTALMDDPLAGGSRVVSASEIDRVLVDDRNDELPAYLADDADRPSTDERTDRAPAVDAVPPSPGEPAGPASPNPSAGAETGINNTFDEYSETRVEKPPVQTYVGDERPGAAPPPPGLNPGDSASSSPPPSPKPRGGHFDTTEPVDPASLRSHGDDPERHRATRHLDPPTAARRHDPPSDQPETRRLDPEPDQPTRRQRPDDLGVAETAPLPNSGPNPVVPPGPIDQARSPAAHPGAQPHDPPSPATDHPTRPPPAQVGTPPPAPPGQASPPPAQRGAPRPAPPGQHTPPVDGPPHVPQSRPPAGQAGRPHAPPSPPAGHPDPLQTPSQPASHPGPPQTPSPPASHPGPPQTPSPPAGQTAPPPRAADRRPGPGRQPVRRASGVPEQPSAGPAPQVAAPAAPPAFDPSGRPLPEGGAASPAGPVRAEQPVRTKQEIKREARQQRREEARRRRRRRRRKVANLVRRVIRSFLAAILASAVALLVLQLRAEPVTTDLRDSVSAVAGFTGLALGWWIFPWPRLRTDDG